MMLALLATAAGCVGMRSTTATLAAPRDGTGVFVAMHDRYENTWFRTLTFVQKTTQRRPDGSEQVSTWYEAQSGSRLRIDIGDPKVGNGVLYTADSAYIVRSGKVVRSVADGNPFLPLISGVYTQPLALTLQQLAPFKVDMSRLREQEWEGKPTYVIGSTSPSDSASPQLWVEKERLIVTRFLMPLIPQPDKRNQDIRLENNVAVGGGWLATHVRIMDAGKDVQVEDYSDWRANVVLPPAFFQAEHWSEGVHWSQVKVP